MLRIVAGLLALVVASGCSGEAPSDSTGQPEPTASSTAGTDGPPTTATEDTPGTPSPDDTTATTGPRVRPADGDPEVAMAAVRELAGRIGPRHGTSPAFRRAARWVSDELRRHGWQVRRQAVPTSAGVSWGVPVPAGRSVNLVASRGERRPGHPWLVVGAHLDTVPQAPGAEDNASGVGSLLAVADALEGRRTRLPVVLVAFGSEEPRGPSDDDHHYGSRRYVAALGPAERRSLQGMVSLDRVGVGETVPVGSPGPEHERVGNELIAAARRVGVQIAPETSERSSDHWSFARNGLPAARLGSTPFAGYHSPQDVPGVIDRAQLARTVRVTLAWLRG